MSSPEARLSYSVRYITSRRMSWSCEPLLQKSGWSRNLTTCSSPLLADIYCNNSVHFSPLTADYTGHSHGKPVETSSGAQLNMCKPLNQIQCHNHFIYRLSTISSSQLARVYPKSHYSSMKMSNFAPTSHNMRTQLLLLIHLNKWALELHCMLVKAYDEYVFGRAQRNEWFNNCKSGNLDASNEEHSTPPNKFEDDE